MDAPRVELLHANDLPEAIHGFHPCCGCPHEPQIRCGKLCEAEYKARFPDSSEDPCDYYFFDPLVFITNRLKGTT